MIRLLDFVKGMPVWFPREEKKRESNRAGAQNAKKGGGWQSPRRKALGRGKIRPLEIPFRTLGARPMAGQLTLDQSIGVRVLCPQHLKGPRQSEGLFI